MKEIQTFQNNILTILKMKIAKKKKQNKLSVEGKKLRIEEFVLVNFFICYEIHTKTVKSMFCCFAFFSFYFDRLGRYTFQQ